MADRLKIYACSGVGDSSEQEQPKTLGFWTDGTNTVSNTKAVNTLLVKINNNRIRAFRLQGISEQEKIHCLNNIDFLVVALDAARKFAKDKEALYRAGAVISQMYTDGKFSLDSINDRELHLDELLNYANSEFSSSDAVEFTDPEILNWWITNVMDQNEVVLNFGQQQVVRKALKIAAEKVSSVGAADESWKDDPDLFKYLNKGSEYFLYLYFTDKQLEKLPAVFKEKKRKQLRTYNYCKALFVDNYGTEQDMKDIIYYGIMDYFGVEPETVCDEICRGERPIGFVFLGLAGAGAIKAFLEFLTILATVVVGIITAVCSMVAQTNIAKYGSLDKQIVESSVPDESDYDGLNFGGGSTKKSNWLIWAAAGIAAIFLLKRN